MKTHSNTIYVKIGLLGTIPMFDLDQKQQNMRILFLVYTNLEHSV